MREPVNSGTMRDLNAELPDGAQRLDAWLLKTIGA
jgi:hypothetical protein